MPKEPFWGSSPEGRLCSPTSLALLLKRPSCGGDAPVSPCCTDCRMNSVHCAADRALFPAALFPSDRTHSQLSQSVTKASFPVVPWESGSLTTALPLTLPCLGIACWEHTNERLIADCSTEAQATAVMGRALEAGRVKDSSTPIQDKGQPLLEAQSSAVSSERLQCGVCKTAVGKVCVNSTKLGSSQV